MAKLWVKSWVISLDKPKIMSLPADQFKCWQVLQWIAGRYNRDGLLPPIEECAFVMHVDAEKARTMMQVLRERGLLDVTADGWRLHDWSDWQEVAEWETKEAWRERKRRQREKQRMSQDVTRDTVTVTEGHGNVTVSHDKKEIEKEIEKDPPVANATSPNGGATHTRSTSKNGKKPATPIPEPFVVTDAMADWALNKGMTANFIRDGTEYFVRWAKSHDHRYANWEATWHNVMTSRWEEQQAKVTPLRRTP